MAQSALPADEYVSILLDYLRTHSEESLYRASLLGKDFIEAGVGPDEITAIHCDAVSEIVSRVELLTPLERLRSMDSAHQFLLEFMVAYGAKYKEHLDYKLNQSVREAEAKLAREREMAELALSTERDKLEILSMIAHELNTPLTAARGNVSVAARLASAGRVADLPPVLDTATSAIERLTKLSGNLLAASQGRAIELEIGRVDLRTIFDTAYEWANALADERLVLIERSRWPEPIMVNADGNAMLTVFGNLLSNAVRYTHRTGQISARDRIDGNEACFEITDTGIGMAPETMEQIFSKFYRSPESRHMEPNGLGIGLYIARELVLAQGGRIEVESVRMSGSTFRVILPLAE